MENHDSEIGTPDAAAQRRVAGSGRIHSVTRERVLRMIEAQSAPVTIAALTSATDLHENTLRGHLEQLHADGYVRRERADSVGRGRPAWLWRATRTSAESPYAGLATALAVTLAHTSADPVRDARAAGRAWGAEIAEARESRDGTDTDIRTGTGTGDKTGIGTRTGTARAEVVAVMRENGFAPDDTGGDVLLRRCPLIEAAVRHPEIVCAVHQGLIDGVLAARGEPGGSTLLPFTGLGVCTLRLPAGLPDAS